MKYEDYERRLDALFATRHLLRESWYKTRDSLKGCDPELVEQLRWEAELNVERCEKTLGKEVCEHFRKIQDDIRPGAGISDAQYNEVFGPVDAEIRDVLRELAADSAVFEEEAA